MHNSMVWLLALMELDFDRLEVVVKLIIEEPEVLYLLKLPCHTSVQ